jgi:hypothetical protein
MSAWIRALGMVVATATSACLITAGRAGTITSYDLNVAQCSGSGCGEVSGFNFGTVVVDISSDQKSATITYDLTTGLLHDTSIAATAAFDMTGVTGVSVSTDSTGTSPAGNPPPAGTPYGWSNVTGGAVGMDGAGLFTNGVLCGSTLSGKTCGTELVLTVTGANLATALSSLANGGFFAAVDISNTVSGLSVTACTNDGGTPNSDGTCTITGVVADSVATPLPSALALFGSVLFGGLGLSKWRGRRGPVSVMA